MDEQKALNLKYAKRMKKAENKNTTEFIDEMREIKKKLNLDEKFRYGGEKYFEKFGILKKATVLLFYERENDAFDEIAKAVEMVKEQKEHDKDKSAAIKKRWCFKLGIDESQMEFLDVFLNYHPDKISDEQIQAKIGDNDIPLATAKLYLQKISPVLNDQYNKDVYLNQAIEDLYLICEEKIIKKKETIDKIKAKITELEEDAEDEEMYGSGEEAPAEILDDNGQVKKRKIKKKLMCESIRKTGKCKNTAKTCKFAHNPIELDIIDTTDKIKNLQTVVHDLDKQMRANKTAQHWFPPSCGDI